MVPCLLCVGELLQDEHADPFASSITIGLSREGFAASIFTEHACFAKTNMKFRGNQNIDAADDSHSTLSTLNCVHPPVNGNQRTGAGCLNWLAGSMQIQKIAHAIGSH